MENKNAILFSLGHNSSAIYTDGRKVIGYEQERIDRIKSSSASPMDAYGTILSHTEIPDKTPMFITHWFDQWGKVPANKYAKGIHDAAKVRDCEIITHTPEFTHHDAHMWSSLSFFRYYEKETTSKLPLKDIMSYHTNYLWFLVVDGFGNQQEVISLYKAMNSQDEPKLVLRAYGYGKSLGLMYQYATSFCGMKMNQDEYKFLGYESKATLTLDVKQKQIIDEHVQAQAGAFLMDWKDGSGPMSKPGDLIDFDALNETQEYWNYKFQKILDFVGGYDRTCDFSRIAIGYFIQEVLEKSLKLLVQSYGIRNLVLSGGVFYNVKVNHSLLSITDGLFSVVPVAGDQGASIGFYEKFVGPFNWETLSIGKRNMKDFKEPFKDLPHYAYIDNEDELIDTLLNKIANGQICNLVTDHMEYGPRALGSTSSLFLPTEFNAEFNNRLNKRNEVMPFAPLIPSEAMPIVFEHNSRRVVGSDKFMILTYDYIKPITDDFRGVAHVYPYNDFLFSGRPQVIEYHRNRVLHEVLTGLWRSCDQMLVTNTSYNYHGEPIVFSAEDIINTHRRQLDNRKTANTAKRLTPQVNLIVYKSKESE